MGQVKKSMESWLVIPSRTNILTCTIAKPRGVERKNIFNTYQLQARALFLFFSAQNQSKGNYKEICLDQRHITNISISSAVAL